MKNQILQNRFEGVLETLLTKNGMFAKLTGKYNYPPVLHHYPPVLHLGLNVKLEAFPKMQIKVMFDLSVGYPNR